MAIEQSERRLRGGSLVLCSQGGAMIKKGSLCSINRRIRANPSRVEETGGLNCWGRRGRMGGVVSKIRLHAVWAGPRWGRLLYLRL